MLRLVKPQIICSCFSHRYNILSLRLVQTSVVPKLDEEKTIPIKKFSEHCVEINTCGKLYEEWRTKKLFQSVPDGDLQFTVRYIDTLKDADNETIINKDSTTVLALHGAPGSYEDYSRFTTFAYEHGIRVIAPLFPDFSQYPPGVFRHSASERAQFLEDFLKAIDVSYLDLLVCHSSAVYPGLKLCIKNTKPTISGLALFNPAAFNRNVRSLRPWWFVNSMVKVSEYSLGLKLYEAIGPTVIQKYSKLPIHVGNPLDPLFSATVMVYAGIQESRALFHQLFLRKFPIFFIFSEDDKLMDQEFSYKLSYALGVQDPHIFHYNEHGVLDKQGKVMNNTKVMAFAKGSHYAYSKHSKIVNEELLDFMNKYIL